MTVTEKEWKDAGDSKAEHETLLTRETKEYLINGGLITRRAKDGSITKWGSLDGVKLHPVKEVKE